MHEIHGPLHLLRPLELHRNHPLPPEQAEEQPALQREGHGCDVCAGRQKVQEVQEVQEGGCGGVEEEEGVSEVGVCFEVA